MSVTGLCLALFMHCSSTSTGFKDNNFKPHIDKFVNIGRTFKVPDIEEKARQLVVRFAKLEDKELGVCYLLLNEININEKEWNRLPPENKEELLFHEMGHCILGYLEHSNSGIMKAVGLHDVKFYRENYNKLITQLFNETHKKDKALTKAEILNNEHAVIRFTASWCPPCKVLAPVFDEVASRYPEVKTYVIDVDKHQDLATEFNVRGIPTLIQVKNNQIEATTVGAIPKEKVEELFK